MSYEVSAQNGRGRDAELLGSLARALSDPLRVKLFTAVCERPGVSIRQIATRVSETERKVRYHMEALHSEGLIEVADEVRRRGAVERRYRVTTSSVIDGADEQRISPGQQRRISLEALKLIMSDATAAVASGHFGTREGHCEVRIHGEVDDEGWAELAELHRRTMREVQGVLERSAERREATDGDQVEVTAALLLFEAPIWDEI